MRILKKTAMMIPLALALGQAQAATHCVNPAWTRCFATIQAAVDAAAPGDTINIAENRSSKGYTENVVINTPDLTLKGRTRGFRPFFGNALVSGGVKEERCPKVIVDACETAADPTDCGVNTETGDAITVNASGVVIQGLLIRHADDGVALNAGADDTTIHSVCFIDNNKHVSSNENEASSATVKESLFRGERGGGAIHLNGDDHQVLRNIFLTTDNGIDISGDNALISKNRFVTSNDECIDVHGDNGKIHDNTLTGCEDPINYSGDQPDIRRNIIERANDDAAIEVRCYEDDPSTCTGGTIADNRINGVADDAQGIETYGDNLVIEFNYIWSLADQGIDYNGSNGIIRGNTVGRSGSESGDGARPGIDIEGDNNLIENNWVNLNSYVGIRNFAGNDNTYRRNRVENNGRSGIYIRAGDNTIVENNTVIRNHGEGINNGGDSSVPVTPTNTTIDNNTVTNNRTDICNDGTVASFVGNTFGTGGIATACVVDQ